MCIDQASISEKSTQVMLMQKIYEQAEKVYIDLGEDRHNCFDLALKTFLVFENSEAVDDKMTEAHVTPGENKDNMHRAMYDLFTYPWFSRV